MNGRRAAAWALAMAMALSNEANAQSAAPSAASHSLAPLRASFDRYPSQPEGQFELARHYESGRGITKDPYLASLWAGLAAQSGSEDAAAWLKNAAEAGDAFAQLQYGFFLKARPSAKRDFKGSEAWALKAIPTLESSARSGDPGASTALALAYRDGLGVKVDVAKELEWLQPAARKGYPPALGEWGLALLKGRGVAADPPAALAVLEGAATLGHFASARDLGLAYLKGKLLPRDHALAVKWLKLAAYNGDRDSQFQTALMLEQADGVPRDYATALDLYRRADALGFPAASNNLGVMIQQGRGTTADPAAAIEWFKKASARGDAFGDYNLGRAHRDGLGVPVNLEEAKKAFGRAVAAGHASAKKELPQLDAVRACLKGKTSAMLFQQPLRCALRGGLRLAIVRSGASATRENDRFWYDTYDSAAVLDGSTVLSVGYTLAGDFAHAEYTFPSSMDTEQVQQVAQMVSIKYGKPQRARGRLTVGPVSFEWTLPDGILLRVSRGWPSTTTSLEYIHPARLAQLRREQSQEDARKKVEQSAAQSNAF